MRKLWESLPVVLLGAMLIALAIVPDEKLVRLKLVVLETGILSVLWVGLLIQFGSGTTQLFVHPILILVWAQALLVLALAHLSQDQVVAGMEVRRMLICAGAFTAGLFFAPRSTEGLKKLLAAWTLGLALAATYGILQRFGGLGPVEVPRMDRVMSTFGNPIFLGSYLALSLPLAWGLCFEEARKPFKMLAGLAAGLGLWALVLTQTRASLLALAAGILIFGWAMEQPRGWPWTKGLVRRKKQLGIALLALAGLHGLLWFGAPSYTNAWRGAYQSAKNLSERHQAHALIWRDTLSLWKDHKWLGSGPGTFHIEFPRYASEDLKKLWPETQVIVNYAHNEFLQTLAETGLIGLALFAGVIALFFLAAGRSLREKFSPLTAALAAGAGAVLVQNFFSVDMRFTISAALLYLTMGLALSGIARERTFVPPAWVRGAVFVALVVGIWPLAQAVVAPYRAHQVVQAQPDFFETGNAGLASDIAQFQTQAQANPEAARPYEEMAYRYAKLKQWDKAITAFQKAVELDPKLFGAYNNLGNIHFLLKKKPEAITYYQKSLEIKPDQIDARLNLGKLLYTQGRLKEAAREFETVLRISPGNEEATLMLKQLVE